MGGEGVDWPILFAGMSFNAVGKNRFGDMTIGQAAKLMGAWPMAKPLHVKKPASKGSHPIYNKFLMGGSRQLSKNIYTIYTLHEVSG